MSNNNKIDDDNIIHTHTHTHIQSIYLPSSVFSLHPCLAQVDNKSAALASIAFFTIPCGSISCSINDDDRVAAAVVAATFLSD